MKSMHMRQYYVSIPLFRMVSVKVISCVLLVVEMYSVLLSATFFIFRKVRYLILKTHCISAKNHKFAM